MPNVIRQVRYLCRRNIYKVQEKVFMLLIVAIANIVDINVIGEGHALKTVTVVFYICNECISLIENAGRLGAA